MSQDLGISYSRVMEIKSVPAIATNGSTTAIRPAISNLGRIHQNTRLIKIHNSSTTETLYIRAYNDSLDYTSGTDLDTYYPILPQKDFELEIRTRSLRTGSTTIIGATTAASSFDYVLLQLMDISTS